MTNKPTPDATQNTRLNDKQLYSSKQRAKTPNTKKGVAMQSHLVNHIRVVMCTNSSMQSQKKHKRADNYKSETCEP